MTAPLQRMQPKRRAGGRPRGSVGPVRAALLCPISPMVVECARAQLFTFGGIQVNRMTPGVGSFLASSHAGNWNRMRLVDSGVAT